MRQSALMSSTVFAASILLLGLAAATKVAGFRSSTGTRDAAGLMQGGAARDFESNYDAQFPAKTFGINLWTAIGYGIFNEGRAGVVVGKEGWLFTDEEFKTYPSAEASIKANLGYIRRVSEYLKRRNSALLIVAVPSKRRLYPEYASALEVSGVQADAGARLGAALDLASIAHVDLLSAMQHCKQERQVFLRTDTHWSPAGARCAAQAVGSAVQQLGYASPSPRIDYETTADALREHRGDLMKFLPLEPYFSSLQLLPDLIEIPHTDAAAGSGDDLFGEAPVPKVVLIGTSYSADPQWNFAGALKQVLGEDVLNRAEAGRGPMLPMRKYLAGSYAAGMAAPRLVIWEVPERMLPLPMD